MASRVPPITDFKKSSQERINPVKLDGNSELFVALESNRVLSSQYATTKRSYNTITGGGPNKQERVFLCTNKKPIETSTTFPDSHIGSQNNFDMFLKTQDETKLDVFKNFKVLNRDLTQAYLRRNKIKCGMGSRKSEGPMIAKVQRSKSINTNSANNTNRLVKDTFSTKNESKGEPVPR
jgi:hypothetical protein